MAGESVDFKLDAKIDAAIKRELIAIAKSSEKADSALKKLTEEMERTSGSSLTKLTRATAMYTNSMLRQKSATVDLLLKQQKLEMSHRKLANSSGQEAIQKQRLATETKRTELATLRLAQAQDRLSGSSKRAAVSVFSLARSFATFAGLTVSGRALIDYIDSFTTLENRLKVVTDSAEQLEAVTARLFEISRKTRIPVEETAKAFQRFDLAMSELGASQEEVLRLTETVNKSLILSGSTTNEQRQALLQLSQAFNKSKLDGDEFRNVMETMPIIAKGIARELGVTRGELLNLASQGKITADVLRRAIASIEKEVDSKFGETVKTLGQSFTVLRNEAIKTIGQFEKATGVFAALSRGIIFLADNMEILISATAFLGTLLIASVIPTLKAFGAALFANPIAIVVAGLAAATTALVLFKDEIKVTSDGFVTLGDVISVTLDFINTAVDATVKFVKGSFEQAFEFLKTKSVEFADKYSEEFTYILDVSKNAVNKIIGFFVASYNTIKRVWDFLPEVVEDAFRIVYNNIVQATEDQINIMIRAWNSIPQAVAKVAQFLVDTFDKLPDMFRTIGDNIGIAILKGIEKGVNKSIEILNKVPGISIEFAKITEDAFEDVGSVLDDAVNFKLKEVDLSKYKTDLSGAFQEASDIAKEEFGKVANTDFIGDAITEVERRAREVAKQVRADLPTQPDLGQSRKAASSGSKDPIKQIELSSFAKQYKEILTIDKDINMARQEGTLTTEQYRTELGQLTLQYQRLQLEVGKGTFSDSLTVGLGKLVEGYKNVLTELSDAFGNFFDRVTDGFADSIGRAIVMGEDLEKSLKRVAQNALAEMISALVKIGIQYLVNAAIGKSAMASTAAVGAAAGAATAAAWAPAATMTSLASFGANAAPATAGMTTTYATAQTLAAAGGLAGFKDGGYTGNYGRSEVAGVVHGQEFVMNADATARNRPVLEAMNRGGSVGSSSTAMGVNITVENYGSSQISVEQVSPTDVRIIAKEAAMKAVREEAPGVIAADISNPNSRVSRSLNQNTKTERKR